MVIFHPLALMRMRFPQLMVPLAQLPHRTLVPLAQLRSRAVGPVAQLRGAPETSADSVCLGGIHSR